MYKTKPSTASSYTTTKKELENKDMDKLGKVERAEHNLSPSSSSSPSTPSMPGINPL